MPAVGMPGPFELLIILVFLTVLLGGFLLLLRASRGGVGPRARGFDPGPPTVRREDHGDDAKQR